jgi:predicted Holliday junction resolvase-like endonuclease
MLDLIDHCTNVEFDMDIFEAKNLSHEAQMITNEILVIFQEIMGETYQLIQLALEQTKNEALQENILNDKKELEMKVEELVEEKEKDIPQKAVRKPQRSRGRVVRK